MVNHLMKEVKDVPWQVKEVMDQRIEFVVRAVSKEKTVSELCQAYGISRTTGHHWIKRYREGGSFAGLREKSRRPHQSPGRTPGWVEQRVLQKRVTHGWGARKLQPLLETEGVKVSERTINRILKRLGAMRREDCHRPALSRFERERPNELWQMDFKGEYVLRGGKNCYPLSMIDDHSRFSVGLYGLTGTSYQGVRACVIRTFQEYGVPEAMLMDHGVPWWGTANRLGLTRLSVELMEQGIRLYYSGVGHPQTQGKVERFHRTLSAGIRHRGGPPQQFAQWGSLLKAFREEYNQVRPHEALQMHVPAQRYEPSQRRYQAQPRSWDYEDTVQVRLIGASGSVPWKGKAYFVSNALSGKWVGVEPVEDKLLVRYQQMYLCEIDLQTDRITSFLQPVKKANRLETATTGGGRLPKPRKKSS